MDLDTEAPMHDQIWDDSALVDSWNDALAEYQKYHSIHAKGGAVEDLLDPEQETTKEMLTSSAVQDEGLKRLLMSWYYAGYYTGLYEGKQQAEQQQTK
ncbi:hypothetical protein B0T18DRAFT_331813 [Schizothecium vesticola]|uniref:Survival Motor Neuron Gemin2-binding domain-containing protein n=1 Tax=Schizothecium vesticola TaxID=314040 RepID=A0AA40EJ01_9PEZI|nr:hypothetical protein B0T18DRAFT_331813 [Schizothecium vesticola]